MNHTAIAIAAGFAFAAALSNANAQTQSARSFVSGLGSDANLACARTTPCRTLAAALLHTSAGGEIDVLDPAGF